MKRIMLALVLAVVGLGLATGQTFAQNCYPGGYGYGGGGYYGGGFRYGGGGYPPRYGVGYGGGYGGGFYPGTYPGHLYPSYRAYYGGGIPRTYGYGGGYGGGYGYPRGGVGIYFGY
jgi:hypothetical protein